MLVLAGLLLLALLVILLVTGRRTELGISRAIGLQRSHLIQLLLFEGVGYSLLAAVLGVLVGSGLTMLELSVISQLPKLAPGEVGSNPIALPVVGALHMWLSWQSMVAALCLGVLTTLVGILLTALWVSRMNIIAAIRDLDESPGRASHLRFW
jgi:putative ABC transport system permease protein